MFVQFLQSQYNVVKEVAGDVLRNVGRSSVFGQRPATAQRDRSDVPQVVVVVFVDKIVIQLNDVFMLNRFQDGRL